MYLHLHVKWAEVEKARKLISTDDIPFFTTLTFLALIIFS